PDVRHLQLRLQNQEGIMKALTRNATFASLVLVGVTMSAYQPSRAEQIVQGTVTAAHYAAAAAATSSQCHIMPVQAGHGARAPGQPGHGLPPIRPDCDIQAGAASAVPGTPSQDMTFHGGPTVLTATSHFIFLNCPVNCATDLGNPTQFLT